MLLIQNLQKLQDTLDQSPLFSIEKVLPNHQGLEQQLKTFRTELQLLQEKCYNPLKIVLMGEVKAGKSTLLNAFAGAAVSPTNVTETTASIIEIKHAFAAKGSILKKSGEVETGTPEKVYNVLREHNGDQDYFANISVVKLEFPLANLQNLHLVDTPGLATVTANNEQTAVDYIQNSDVVLWVFSAHHLGQWDIEEKLANVKSYGKPIVAVVNRIDEINGTPEDVKDYLLQRLGFFLEEVFPISAYQAFEGIRSGNKQLLQQSGYPELLHYLEENIEKQEQQVQEHSILNSAKAIGEKERIQHQIVGDKISFLLKSMDRRKEEIEYHNSSIKRKIKLELQNWISIHFLDEEKRGLMRDAEGLGIMSGKGSYDAISSKVNEIVSSEHILGILEKKFAEMNQQFKQEWEDAIVAIGEKISLEDEEFRQNQLKLYENNDVSLSIYLPQGENAVADGAVKGATIGGAYGLAAATYVAAIGPSAASITMGAALGAIMPPVLLIGAVTGIAAKLVYGNKKKKNFSHEILSAVDEAKRSVSDVFLPKMQEQLELESNRIAYGLYDKLCDYLSQGWTEKELVELEQQIKTYTSNLFMWDQEVVQFQ